MYAPRKVFIIENGSYTELTYQEFCRRKEIDLSYTNKQFLPIQGCLMEVNKEQYVDFYREKERWEYLKKQDRKQNLFSIDTFGSDDVDGENCIPDQTEDVVEVIAHSEMLQKLREKLPLLPETERLLIQKHFYEGMSQADLGRLYGISQSSISRHMAKILAKLKKLLEN